MSSTLIGDTRVTVHGSGPTLFLCHGFTTTGAFWREQIDAFSKTHRLVIIDLPGHGTSPHPQERDYTMEAFVNDIELVFQTLHITDAVLIGLSMGGTIAQGFALRNPELLRALVLVGATPHGLGPDVRVDNVLKAIEELGVEQASQAVIDRSFGAMASKQLVDFARNEVIQTPAFVARKAIASLNAADSRSHLGLLKLPALVVCGEEDRITPPAESRALAQGLPHAELLWIPQAAHFPMLEQPAAFNEGLRRFIDKLPALRHGS